MTVLASS